MNYIAQLNAFDDWAMINRPSTGQYALYLALLQVNNKCGWKEWFAAPNSIIDARITMTKQGIAKARDYLSENGLIEFKSRSGNQATLYRLIPMGQIVAAPVATNDSMGQIVAAPVVAELPHQLSILKQETKTEKKINAPALYQNVIGMMDTVIAQKMILDIDEYGEDWVCEAIEKAALQNKKTYAYVQGVLKGWHREGKGSSKVAKEEKASRMIDLEEERQKRERELDVYRSEFGELP